MPDRHEFLCRLEADLAKNLPALEAATFAAEARNHLEDSIQARLELGATPEEAEREALIAFGKTADVVQESRPREPWIDRRFLGAALAVVAYWAFFGGGRSFPDWVAAPMLALFAVVHGGYLFAGSRTRRFQGATLALVLLPLWVGLSVIKAQGQVAIDGPSGPQLWSRGTLRQDAADHRRFANTLRTKYQTLLHENARYRSGEIATCPSRTPGFDEAGRLLLYAHGPALANERWKDALRHGADAANRVAPNNDRLAERLEAAVDAPSWSAVPLAAVAVFKASGWPVASAYVGMYAWAWTLGFALRRRSGRGGALA